MEQLILETEQDLIKLQEDLVRVNTQVCTHAICDECKLNIENEAKEKLSIQTIINEKMNFLEKIKQYGTQ
jgi:hypothetical protein